MSVVAITPIRHGNDDGTITEFNVGDSVTGLSDDQLYDLCANGSAVEIGSTKKYPSPYYSPELLGGAMVDEDTVKRDALIAQAQGKPADSDEPLAVSAGSSDVAKNANADSDKK